MKLDNENIKLQSFWATNVIMEGVDITDEDNQELIRIGKEHSKVFKHVPDIQDPNRQGYNLFNVDHPAIDKLAALIKSRVQMLMKVDGFIEPEKYDIEAVAAYREHEHGDRSKTHNHRGCDYVAVYYADLDPMEGLGDNFKQPKGRFIFTDPISQRSRAMNHTQNVDVVVYPKMLVMHPAYLYHFSEPYLGKKTRSFFTIVMRVAEPIQAPFYKKL